ncbi:transglutaminase-like domain-containing protein [Geopsychrobacter electrodiphilus]|uniref:transglutaminase-like domain-containing protein n=1 Tax=Geopsychrobacter electrodiphilus TaxID=225196 RepID=UPI00037109BC|nr:transglutaminase family protein [Geopsychrobacter electrodiphilus]
MIESCYLEPAEFIDSDHPAIQEFALKSLTAGDTALDHAVDLYYRVRDGIRYTPYLDYSDPEMYRASSVLRNGFGFCISKASLLAACGRVLQIESRVGFGDVTNHLNSSRLREINNGDIMRWHAFTEFHLEDRWVKATPAFNLELCTRFRIKPLEFNGLEDSIFHPFDADQRRHMEYLKMRGTFADIPLPEILATWKRHSPKLLKSNASGDFGAEAEIV